VSLVLSRILVVGLVAGFVAGAVLAVVQQFRIAPLIAAAEVYEDAAAEAHAHDAAAAGHDHMQGMAEAAAAWEPAAGLERLGFTLLADLIVAVGFAFVLSGGFAVRQSLSGHVPGAWEGFVWGLAGFAAFALAPALGLPPEPPGMISADIYARQEWWLGTACATVAGIAAIAFGRSWLWRIAGIVLLLAPHLIGAPLRPEGTDAVPASIAAQFVAASLVTTALFWIVLGSFSGWLYARLDRRAPSAPA
jgi:cobalt transporter subunit CbtA